MKTSWRNVNGTFSIETYTHGLVALDIDDKPLEILNTFCFINGIGDAELIIEFTSTGYNDPGSMYGGPDNLGWPPEGDDERLLSNAYLKVDNQVVKLPQRLQNVLFNIYIQQIEAVELEYDDSQE